MEKKIKTLKKKTTNPKPKKGCFTLGQSLVAAAECGKWETNASANSAFFRSFKYHLREDLAQHVFMQAPRVG